MRRTLQLRLGALAGSYGVIGHSLGGAVSCYLAVAAPREVSRVVLLEIAGPGASGSPGEEVRALRRAVAVAAARGQPRQPAPAPGGLSASAMVGGVGDAGGFASIDDAAERRSKKNFGGRLPLPCARALVERQLRPMGEQTDGVERWCYRSDPTLAQGTRAAPRYSPETVLAFLRAIACPCLMVTARDGMYGVAFRAGAPAWLDMLCGDMFTARSGVLMRLTAVVLRLVGALLRIAAIVAPKRVGKAADRVVSLRDRIASAQFTASSLAYFRWLKRVQLPVGGHHCHMTRPGDVAAAITEWCRSN